MTNIILKLFDLEIKNKQIIEKKWKIYSKFARGFKEAIKAQSRITGQEA
jgi:hypothetical protein